MNKYLVSMHKGELDYAVEMDCSHEAMSFAVTALRAQGWTIGVRVWTKRQHCTHENGKVKWHAGYVEVRI